MECSLFPSVWITKAWHAEKKRGGRMETKEWNTNHETPSLVLVNNNRHVAVCVAQRSFLHFQRCSVDTAFSPPPEEGSSFAVSLQRGADYFDKKIYRAGSVDGDWTYKIVTPLLIPFILKTHMFPSFYLEIYSCKSTKSLEQRLPRWSNGATW